MTTTLLAALLLLVTVPGLGLVWTCAVAGRLRAEDRATLAPTTAILFFAGLTATALVVPWSFRLQATIGLGVWVAGGLLLLRPAVRTSVLACLRGSWCLLLPLVLCFLAVAAFGAVQGDPRDTVAYPGTIVSARVTNLPPDHLFPLAAAQIFQHRIDPMHNDYYAFWDFSDRTPLAAAVTASLTSGAGVELPSTAIWQLPPHELRPRVLDDLGYWQVHLVLVLLNALVVVAIGRLAFSIWGAPAALVAGLLAAANPFVFTHVFFTWPKMLAAYFVLMHYAFVREKRSPLLTGATAGLAYLAHPLAAIFVVPLLAVTAWRAPRRATATLGVLVATILPWQVWTLLYAHTSRMLTYPLGYTMRNPSDLGGELRKAWDGFTALGIGHAIHVRIDDIVDTVWPFGMQRNFLSLPGRSLIGSESWFTVHDRTLGGMALFMLLPALVVGLVVWHRRARWEWAWLLAAPLVLAVLFWGIDPQGLGAAMLQPTGAVVIAVTAGGLCTLKRPLAIAIAVLASVEAATVVWWGLFATRPGAGTASIVVAIAIWALAPLATLLVLSRPRRPRAHSKAGTAKTPELGLADT